ncbi:hypothetical protein [Nitrospira defluvii]|uniref:Uncharacterized protein n=1 Tax=Nitrospira defluvii TaxID=330214 RepID=A0ABN7LYI4_9BACT|nr:hypothetical protein [Nitrospira defluvii]CAE6770170.1 hypothetical protein NSPZN2_40242 [Nitrospira defluvii]
MDHIVAFAVIIIGAGLIAKVFPKIMTQIFDHYPQHFSPTHKTGSGDEIPEETWNWGAGQA